MAESVDVQMYTVSVAEIHDPVGTRPDSTSTTGPQVCLPICDGTEGSCPCDHRCMPKRFELQGEPHSMVVNLCRPPDAGKWLLYRSS